MKKIFLNEEYDITAVHDLSQDITYPFTKMIVTDKDVVFGSKFIPDYEDEISTLRFIRDEKIKKTDWMLNPDLELVNKQEVISYRETLRDLPNNFLTIENFSNGITFPTEITPVFKELTIEEKILKVDNGIVELKELSNHPVNVLPGKLFLYGFQNSVYARFIDGTYLKIK